MGCRFASFWRGANEEELFNKNEVTICYDRDGDPILEQTGQTRYDNSAAFQSDTDLWVNMKHGTLHQKQISDSAPDIAVLQDGNKTNDLPIL